MKHIIYILLFCLFAFNAFAQVPVGVPSQKWNGWIEPTYVVPDSGSVLPPRDTSWTPRFRGSTITWFHAGVDTVQWFWAGNRWKKVPGITSVSTPGIDNVLAVNQQLTADRNINVRNHVFSIIARDNAEYLHIDSTIQTIGDWDGTGGSGMAMEIFGRAGRVIQIGDVGGGLNGTSLQVRDGAEEVTMNGSGSVSFAYNTASGFLSLEKYGDSLVTGTRTTIAAFDHNGKLIEVLPSSLGGTGTVTSVGLSMPASFTVSGTNPITTSGTFSISMPGSPLDYLRANGTTATFDTTAIPNFYLKVRGLHSGTSPITYSTTTGAIGIQNANASGTKGAATFSPSDFTDNGSGTISISDAARDHSITTGSRTVIADWSQNWSNHQLLIDSIGLLQFTSKQLNATKSRVQHILITGQGSSNSLPLYMSTNIRSAANSFDSVRYEIGLGVSSGMIVQSRDIIKSKTVAMYQFLESGTPNLQLLVDSSTRQGKITIDPSKIQITPRDSLYIFATPAATADSILAIGTLEPSAGKINKVLKIPTSALTSAVTLQKAITNSGLLTTSNTVNIDGNYYTEIANFPDFDHVYSRQINQESGTARTTMTTGSDSSTIEIDGASNVINLINHRVGNQVDNTISVGGGSGLQMESASTVAQNSASLVFSATAGYQMSAIHDFGSGVRNSNILQFTSDSVAFLHDTSAIGFDGVLRFYLKNLPSSSNASDSALVKTSTDGRLAYRATTTTPTLYSGDGTLSSNRTVSSGGNSLTISGANNSGTLLTVNNTGTSSKAIAANGTSVSIDAQTTNGIAITAYSTNNVGLSATSDGSEALLVRSNATSGSRGARIQSVPTSTNTVQEVLRIERGVSGSPGAAGIGGSIDYYNKASDNTSVVSNQIISKLTTATVGSYVSQLSITGVTGASSGVIATFDGNANATFGTTNSIVGTATNNNAVAGNIGEEVSSTVSTYTNYTTTATYQNIASITLSAGDWDIAAQGTFSSNGATITGASDAIFVISTTTASASGATEGKNISYVPQAALLGTSHESISISPYRVPLSGSTTYYLNTQATFTLGNPQFVGTIRARRVR